MNKAIFVGLLCVVFVAGSEWVEHYKAFHETDFNDLDGWFVQNEY
jgi:hypothetical protein